MYSITIIDDKSRFTWVLLMRIKFETSNLVKLFIFMVENQFSTHFKCILSDNGYVFKLNDFYNIKGIVHHTSFVGTSQQNEIV